MKSKQIGPFTVSEMSVDEGLDLVVLANKGDPETFQKEIILRCVKKDGQEVRNLSFREVMPYFKQLIDAAFELNGFRSDEDEQPV